MQSRAMSLVEVVTSSLIGLVVFVFANWAVLPLFGMSPLSTRASGSPSSSW